MKSVRPRKVSSRVTPFHGVPPERTVGPQRDALSNWLSHAKQPPAGKDGLST